MIQRFDFINATLSKFFTVDDDLHATALLVQLLYEHADPIIRAVIRDSIHIHLCAGGRSTDGNAEAEDLYADIQMNLMKALQKARNSDRECAITSFKAYVARTAYHACAMYLKTLNPERHRLGNAIRYALKKGKNIALWEDENGQKLCGFTSWQYACPLRTTRFHNLQVKSQEFLGYYHPDPVNDKAALYELLIAIFDWVGKPILFKELVAFIANLKGIKDYAIRPNDDENNYVQMLRPDSSLNIEKALEKLEFLRWLWSEIKSLSYEQRVSLLLNFRDTQGNPVLHLLVLTRIASLSEIAATLEMSVEEFSRIVKDLPFDDDEIAQRLGATRRQVINWRSRGRERLYRRARKYWINF
jgi:DNA-directed RNA polymerase specialized sigma24 family protein